MMISDHIPMIFGKSDDFMMISDHLPIFGKHVNSFRGHNVGHVRSKWIQMARQMARAKKLLIHKILRWAYHFSFISILYPPYVSPFVAKQCKTCQSSTNPRQSKVLGMFCFMVRGLIPIAMLKLKV